MKQSASEAGRKDTGTVCHVLFHSEVCVSTVPPQSGHHTPFTETSRDTFRNKDFVHPFLKTTGFTHGTCILGNLISAVK